MLRLEIAGSWEPQDFADLLNGIDSLYYKAAIPVPHLSAQPFLWHESPIGPSLFEAHLDRINYWLLTRARTIADGDARSRVVRIEYGSPGNIDLLGLGKAFEAIERLIGSLFTFFADRHLRRERDKQAAIETEIKQEHLRALKIKNAHDYLKLVREFPDLHEDLALSLIVRDQDKLIPMIAEGKLVGVSMPDSEVLKKASPRPRRASPE